MLEKAFETNGQPTPFVATNDTHLAEAMDIIEGRQIGSVVFKIHGCVKKDMEHLILTRRDYRHHYRNNSQFFETIIELLLKRHTLFVGFSHRDPEVSRLVDDAIHQFENAPDRKNAKWPQLYSLQFDMQAHTPEIFAARGIVALTPPTPPFDTEPKNVRSQSLASGLADLLIAKSLKFHKDSDSRLDLKLGGIVDALEGPLEQGLDLLENYHAHADSRLLATGSDAWLSKVVQKLDRLAGQGVFLANAHGQIVAHALPAGLHSERTSQIVAQGVAKRPYFRIANSYRKAFVSDTTESIFNHQSTFFLCMPILRDGRFEGLLFSAAQVGQWMKPIELAEKVWKEDRGFILTDSNGVCLIPAFDEFGTVEAKWKGKKEDAGANNGYPYKKLLGVSRRDHLVKHIARSVVPVQQDDDVLHLAKDSSYYTVVSEINHTRWKVAISMPLNR